MCYLLWFTGGTEIFLKLVFSFQQFFFQRDRPREKNIIFKVHVLHEVIVYLKQF